MEPDKHGKKLDELISSAIHRKGLQPDFKAWKQKYQSQIQQIKSQTNKVQASLPAKSNVWRIIMKTRITKLAAAAVIILIAVLAITFMDKTVTPAYALERSIKAMKNVAWMHAVPSSMMEGGESVFGETWFSATNGISAMKRGDGSAEITYYDKDESYRYDPTTGTITLFAADEADILSRTNSCSELFDNIIDTLNKHNGTEITKTSEVQNGEKVIVLEVKVPKGEPQGHLGTEIWRFVMDEKSFLPIRMQLQGYKADGEFIEVFDIVYDYPSSGPMDIYQLGVPKAAKIIDKRPSIDVQSIIENYQMVREKDVSRYTALVLYTASRDGGLRVAEEAIIYYVDGNKFRRESLSPTWEIIDSQGKGRLDLAPEMGDSLESMLNWWTNREHLSLRRAEMYDGKYMHRVVQELNVTEFQNNYEVNTKSRVRNIKPPNLHDMFTGGSNFLRLTYNDVSKDPEITLIENEYSKQNNLICLQRLDKGREFPFVSGGRRYKRLCYIDQDRGYICKRMEEYFIQDERWQKEYKDAERCLVKNPDASLEYTMLLVKEITELGQSEDGKSYPKRIESRSTTQRENGRLKENISTFTIYMDTGREFSEDIFNSDAFSEYLE